jgi:hypothetical protein
MPASPGYRLRKAASASVGLANGLGWPPTALRVVRISGSTPGSARAALPCRFQLVAQHDRQLITLKGNPLDQRPMPAMDQLPMIALVTPLAPPPNRLPSPNGSSASQFTLIWCRTSKSE